MKRATLNRLIKLLCAKEKKKKQIDAGQAREIIKILIDTASCKDCKQEQCELHHMVQSEIFMFDDE